MSRASYICAADLIDRIAHGRDMMENGVVQHNMLARAHQVSDTELLQCQRILDNREDATQADRHVAAKCLSEALGIPDALLEPPEDMARDLECARQGAPSYDLLLKMSPAAEQAIEHLAYHWRYQAPIAKVIVSDTSESRSAVARLLHRHATHSRAAQCTNLIPVPLVVGMSQTASPEGVVHELILHESLVTACLDALAREAHHEAPRREGVLSWLDGVDMPLPEIKAAFQEAALRIAEAAQEGEYHDWLAREARALCKGLDGVFRPGGPPDMLLEYLYKHAPIAARHAAQEPQPETLSLASWRHWLAGMLTIYREAGLYPVWIIDQFECYSALPEDCMDRVLGLYAEMIALLTDVQYDSRPSGSLLVVTSPDGEDLLHRHRELSRRVNGGGQGMSCPTWGAGTLEDVDARSIVSYMLARHFYLAAEGEPVSKALVDYFPYAEDSRTIDLLDAIMDKADMGWQERITTVSAALAALAKGPEDFAEHMDCLALAEGVRPWNPEDPAALRVKTAREVPLGSDFDRMVQRLTASPQQPAGMVSEGGADNPLPEALAAPVALAEAADTIPMPTRQGEARAEAAPSSPARDTPLWEFKPAAWNEYLRRKYPNAIKTNNGRPRLNYHPRPGLGAMSREKILEGLLSTERPEVFAALMASYRDAGGKAKAVFFHEASMNIPFKLLHSWECDQAKEHPWNALWPIVRGEAPGILVNLPAERGVTPSHPQRLMPAFAMRESPGLDLALDDEVIRAEAWKAKRDVINPTASVSELRHFIYLLTMDEYRSVLSDEWVDQLALELYRHACSVKPREENGGPAFYMRPPTNWWLPSFLRKEPVKMLTQVSDDPNPRLQELANVWQFEQGAANEW